MPKEKKFSLEEEKKEIKSEFARAKNEFKTEVVDKQDTSIIAAIGYVWILFLIPLLLKKDDAFCQHHAKQGLVLFIFSLIVLVFGSIPVVGWFLIMPVGWLIIFVFIILGMTNALRGNVWEMPYLGKFAKKL